MQELQEVLAGKDPDPQAALERCSVSGDAAVGDPAWTCDIKDALRLALAIEGRVSGVSGVCERNTPERDLDP